jgi:hypothetical protein
MISTGRRSSSKMCRCGGRGEDQCNLVVQDQVAAGNKVMRWSAAMYVSYLPCYCLPLSCQPSRHLSCQSQAIPLKQVSEYSWCLISIRMVCTVPLALADPC